MTDEPMSCPQVAEGLPELALGVLKGRERAAALAHLHGCAECREELQALSAVGDRLLGLVPAVEPPVGFESRALDRLAAAQEERHHAERRRFASAPRRRTLLVAAVVALAVLVGAGGWAIGHRGAQPAPTAVAPTHQARLLSAPLRSGNQVLGHAFVYTGATPWLYMDVRTGTYGGMVECQATYADGVTAVVGSYVSQDGDATWGARLDDGVTGLTSVQVTAPDGSVIATATFVT